MPADRPFLACALRRVCQVLALCLCLCGLPCATGHAAPAGYLDHGALGAALRELDASPHAALSTLATTAGGRSVYLLTVTAWLDSGGKAVADSRPAIAICGGAEGSQLLGTELCLRMARALLADATSPEGAELLSRFSFYFLPQLSPDGSAAMYARHYSDSAVNTRPMDDDGDFRVDEDPPKDLNGDGMITMLRVADPAGGFMPHPEDARLMIKADAAKNEAGPWALYVEGRDMDGDGRIAEDGAGGVNFNRNWTFNYPYFAPGAGPHQVSEPETRAAADFLFAQPNVALVLSFTPEDNMITPWRHQPGPVTDNMYSSPDPQDEALLKYLSEEYRSLREESGLDSAAPPSPSGAGSFSEWAYYHYGRFSIALRGWWPPEAKKEDAAAKAAPAAAAGVEADDSAAAQEASPDEKNVESGAEDKKKKDEKDERGKFELAALKWMDSSGTAGFVPWQKIEHPDFPEQAAEVGGFFPGALLNPPAAELDSLGELHTNWLREICGLMPKLSIAKLEADSLGSGVVSIKLVLLNSGYLPTQAAMGELTRQAYPLQAELMLPEGGELLAGSQRRRIARIAGHGQSEEIEWLLRVPAGGDISVRAYAPAVGSTEARLAYSAAGEGGSWTWAK